MFSQLSDRFTGAIRQLRGLGRLTDDNIQSSLRTIRTALLEADVAIPIVKAFIDLVLANALGQNVRGNIRPGEALIKVVMDELIVTLGETQAELSLAPTPPAVILMAGLQGSGKTTTVAKLALWLKNNQKKKVLVVSTDIYRPAAIDQLQSLAEQIEVEWFPSQPSQKPKAIAEAALKHAKSHFADVLIVDTAGRLHIDDAMMQEIRELHAVLNPIETLLVVDSMTGQDAANVAKAFHEALPLTGVVLTKTDGDARGGAALSMRMITGKPIKFIGAGEKVDAFEPFYPNCVASRILGMGDIVGLVESVQEKINKQEADQIAKKLQGSKRFDFNDFLTQLHQMKKLGSLQSLVEKLPGFAKIPKNAAEMMDDGIVVKMEAMILSMTKKERRFPALLNGSRKQRIAAGSGTTLQDVGKLLKQFMQMQKMLKRFGGNKMDKRMRQLQQMQDQLPPELRKQLMGDLDS